MEKSSEHSPKTLFSGSELFFLPLRGSKLLLSGKTLFGLLLAIFFLPTADAQQLHVPYVTTPPEVVDKMLDIADVGPGDYVIDLGAGDGRILIEAARRGSVGHGLEIDPELVRKAEKNAQKASVSEKIMFLKKDVFNADFSQATVITTYMTTTLHTRLRPSLLKDLSPGTRVVSHDFHMGTWEADKHVELGDHDIYYWVVPATIEGRWYWEANGKKFSMYVRQTFQEIRIKIRSEDDSLKVNDSKLIGKRISFTANNPENGNHYTYHGVIDEIIIEGMVQIDNGNQKGIENWSATLHK
ncbi:MAG: class I SAM-dependent methyltransferase [Bacteroidota bacterium]